MPRSWHQNIKRASAAGRTSAEGIVFDSKAELRRWCELQVLQKAGRINALERQLKFPIVIDRRPVRVRSRGFPAGRPAVYTADFTYWDVENQRSVIEEFKGHDTAESRFRRAVVEAIYDIEITVTGPAASATPRKAGSAAA